MSLSLGFTIFTCSTHSRDPTGVPAPIPPAAGIHWLLGPTGKELLFQGFEVSLASRPLQAPWYLSHSTRYIACKAWVLMVQNRTIGPGGSKQEAKDAVAHKREGVVGHCLQLFYPGSPRQSWVGGATSPGSWVPPFDLLQGLVMSQ